MNDTSNTRKANATLRLTHELLGIPMSSKQHTKQRLFGCPFVISWNSSKHYYLNYMRDSILGPQRYIHRRYLKESPLAIQNWIIGLMLPFWSHKNAYCTCFKTQTFYLGLSKNLWLTLNSTNLLIHRNLFIQSVPYLNFELCLSCKNRKFDLNKTWKYFAFQFHLFIPTGMCRLIFNLR